MCRLTLILRTLRTVFARAVMLATWLPVATALAVPMQHDSNGFDGIPWGAAFSESDTFIKIEDSGRVRRTPSSKAGSRWGRRGRIQAVRTIDENCAYGRQQKIPAPSEFLRGPRGPRPGRRSAVKS